MGNLDQKRILVTGGGGFIAAHVVPALLSAGAQVSVISRSHSLPWRLEPLAHTITYTQFSEYRSDSLERLISSTEPDAILHLAGLMPRWSKDATEFMRVNVDQTVALYEAALNARVTSFVTFGSQFEVEGAPLPWTEDSVGTPQTPYGISKARATQELQKRAQAETTVTILRPSTVYGPAQTFTMAIPIWIKASLEKAPLALPVAHNTADFIHVHDVVSATLQSISRRGDFRIFNIASGDSRLVESAALEVARLCKYENPTRVAYGDPTERKAQFSIQRPKLELDWQPRVAFNEGLADTVAWYENHRTDFPRLVVA